MPEGDTIHYAANRIRPILAGRVPELRTPHPRLKGDRWPERLGGREVTAVEAHGKHLFLHFEGDLLIHSHLRMTGSWGTYRAGQRWRRSPRRAWLVMSAADRDVVQFDGPVLELMTESRSRFDQRIAGLGPDIIKEPFDEARVLRRLREEDPTRPIGDVLLQQQVVAGIGNLWKVEGCWAAEIDPWRPAGNVSDDEVLAILRGIRPKMQQSALDGMQDKFRVVYGRKGRPCPRCGTRIDERGQWEANRATYWCPGCQR
jgi:endonuclease VIII